MGRYQVRPTRIPAILLRPSNPRSTTAWGTLGLPSARLMNERVNRREHFETTLLIAAVLQQRARPGDSASRRKPWHQLHPGPGSMPDRALALARYRALASSYDAKWVRIAAIRECAMSAIAARPGENVADVACGTGAMLRGLLAGVGSRGRVIGIEQCPEMMALASARLAFIPLFVVYMNRFQILPEEGAVGIFGAEFDKYRTQVRRWL